MHKKNGNPNTPELWDKKLFQDGVLTISPYYVDKINRVSSYLKSEKGNFLDIGFGTGYLESKLINGNTKLKIFGVDFSKKAVQTAKQKFKGNFYISKIQALPFRNMFFECAVMLDVLEHISQNESKKVLDEVARVIRNRGLFIISVPLNEDLKRLNKEGKNFNAHLREYTSQVLKKELKQSGFEIIKEDYIVAFSNFYFLKNLVLKLIPGFRKPNLLIVYCRKK